MLILFNHPAPIFKYSTADRVEVCSADAVGDLFFDLLEVLPYPIACPNGTNTSSSTKYGPNPCLNPEAGGVELMVNKLTLEVDTRYSG